MGNVTLGRNALAHSLFQVCFSNDAGSIVYCTKCGAYCGQRLNSALRSLCPGSPGQAGKAALSRINRGRHPSRVPALRRAIVVGQPSRFVLDCVGSTPAGSSNGSVVRSLSAPTRHSSKMLSVLERVKARESASASPLSNVV